MVLGPESYSYTQAITMNPFGEVAVQATELIRVGKCSSPAKAWAMAADGLMPHSLSLQEKSCPKSAYLGLCEDGLVDGVPAGSYTRSRDNKQYALRAVELLQQEPDLANARSRALWDRVLQGAAKAHNSQMDVVLALWRNGRIVQTLEQP